jgi:hypothetical protein
LVSAPVDLSLIWCRRLRQVEKLSLHQQKILLGTIDAFIAKVS